jgi:hypothetical protein
MCGGEVSNTFDQTSMPLNEEGNVTLFVIFYAYNTQPLIPPWNTI